jgi:hypothetical protein
MEKAVKGDIMKAVVIALVFAVLVAGSYGCATIRTDVVKPALTEELAWTKMMRDWSIKAYASKDFRAGFILAATKPYLNQMPVTLGNVIYDISSAGDVDSADYKAGIFGGNTLAFYCIATGQGVRFVLDQLFSLGMFPTSVADFLMLR